MSKSIAFVGALFLTVLLMLPAASAQSPTERSISLSLVDLATTMTTNGTVLAIPFKVSATMTGPVCPSAMPASYDVALTAVVVNATANGTTVEVNPTTVNFRGSNLPVAATATTRTADATLLVYSTFTGVPVNATVTVTATYTAGTGGCAGTTTAGASATQDVEGSFTVPAGYSSSQPPGQELPALSFVALAALLVGIAASRRAK